MLSTEEKELINGVVDGEGFDYGFAHYTDFPEIDDKEFHELRNEYLEARQNLLDYCDIED
jgi:hypothetical protein